MPYSDPPIDEPEYCSKGKKEFRGEFPIHCVCWYDGESCCRCGDNTKHKDDENENFDKKN